MEQNDIKSTLWNEEELSSGTSGPAVSALGGSTLPVASIAGLTVLVLVAIALVFLLGVLIDCRQQKLLEKKMGEVKRLKNQRRVNTNPEGESVSITSNMEEPGLSIPPSEILRTVP
ncbi:uncharacterized protein LOC105397723 [Plutella xylostella]|uniref:uncharacterized protein LOC105397723 n=1 Tax=Plutella xylostella TaxID=51655 RepID=UPI0020331BEF|nr:uncharacterized protein LOC105397723 [Plutella xylostella]